MAARGRYIVMLGYAGARTALSLAELHREEVQKHFPKHFLKQEAELKQTINCLMELTDVQRGQKCERVTLQDWLREQGLPQECMVAMKENEVFPSLWKLAECLNTGLEVELRKIPVLQLVIEISELYDANPYVNRTALENKKCFGEVVLDAWSGDTESAVYSVLIATDEPEALIAFAEEKELPAAIIGRLNDKNDRVVRNGEIIRYLTPEG